MCRALGARVGVHGFDTTKVRDNDLLRLPGTVNHKPGGRPVEWLIRPDAATVRVWEPSDLAARLGVRLRVPRPVAAPLKPRRRPEPARGWDCFSPARMEGLVRTVREAPDHEGHKALLWASCRLGECGLDLVAARPLVAAYVARRPGQPGRERDAQRTVRDGLRRGREDGAR